MKKWALLLLLLVAVPAEAVTVCTVGDSITGAARRMRTQLYNQHPDWEFIGNRWDGKWFHDGIAGDTTADVVARLDTIPPCDIAIVLIGTNDWQTGITMDGTLLRLQRIVNTLSGNGTQVYLLRLLPRCDDPGLNLWNANINVRMVDEVVGATQINTWRALMDSTIPMNELLFDCLHPSTTGYDELADYIGPRITYP